MEERNEKIVLTEIKDILSDWARWYGEFDYESALLDYEVVRCLLNMACERFDGIEKKVAELEELIK